MDNAKSITPSPGVPRLRVAAVILQDDRILLVRHEKAGRSYWLLPGGGVDYGESLAEALVRELREETSLDITVGKLVIVNDSIPDDGHRHVVNLAFTASIVDGELRCGSDRRLAEVAFMPLSELPNLTFFPDIRDTLITAIQEHFPHNAEYLGNLWRD